MGDFYREEERVRTIFLFFLFPPFLFVRALESEIEHAKDGAACPAMHWCCLHLYFCLGVERGQDYADSFFFFFGSERRKPSLSLFPFRQAGG